MNEQHINVARAVSGFLGSLAPDVVGLFPDMIATPDDKMNTKIREAVSEQLSQLFLDMCDFLDDHISGFWSSWTPAQRLELYEANEPVFIDATLVPYWLQAAEAGAAGIEDVLRPGSMWWLMWWNVEDPPPPVPDPETGAMPPPRPPVIKGIREPNQVVKMLKDYASQQAARDKRQQADEGEIDVASMLVGA